MSKVVTIYKFQVYDVANDQVVMSKRWGTREAIVKIAHGRVIEETASEVEESPSFSTFTSSRSGTSIRTSFGIA
jgi:hypothetical protein